MNADNHFDVIILGAGPAGLTAGIYLSRARVKTLIIDEGMAGGQLILTHQVANYPGIENISGFLLANNMRLQAEKFGCVLKQNVAVSDFSLEGKTKFVTLNSGETFTSNALIITSGGRSRVLNVEGENDFKGRGISYCATCDGDFFTGKEIIVVGGGNSALEEAVSLTKYASKVTIVHQFSNFQAFPYAIKEAEENEKINFILESKIKSFYGKDALEGVVIENITTGVTQNFPINGVFIFIGYVPNTEFLEGKVALNPNKEIITDQNMATNVEGVFAAGDSVAKRFRQISIAVGEGTVAALAASAFIHELKRN